MSRRKPRGGEAREAQLPFEPMANARPEAVLDGQADRLPQQQLAEADDRLAFEKALWGQGAGLVCGVDEVGRGCLFGDVVAAAVVLPAGLVLDGVHDSKKLSEKKREQLYDVIAESAVAWAVARIDAAEIDRINIRQASRLAMKKAVEALGVTPDHLLVDAETVEIDLPQTRIIHGDALSQSIGAASIMAKVTRDRLCKEIWDLHYPEYGIAVHKGYATARHREALARYGPTTLHRRSFLGKILPEEQLQLF
ncbi:ribonuclease HII [Paenibacillus sp. FSL W8-1187]|uniref:Ribonuclease HII n=1 Tax=Paenibacillus pasadenensis TaxID=217090 RepID=A0A2N5N7F9_9BACL|nr:ribonuclease HII [Paenibacillus pasadenensis]PLT46219.1 Ribonuclease HII [Paenibacillus pasadenensis]